MAPLRLTVECFRCTKPVDKNSVRVVDAAARQFECFPCFQKHREIHMETPEKRDLYCEKCRYQFTARKAKCPYCSSSQYVTKAVVSLKELI